MTQAFPLQWPPHLPRTPAHRREFSRFDMHPDRAQREMLREIERMGGSNVVISTMQRRRQDGGIYAADLKRQPDDPGVAVYFTRKGRPVCFACDKHPRLWENMRAIGKTIEAMRGIERWGSAEMLDAAFTGFAALPPPGSESAASRAWWVVLGCSAQATADEVRAAYKARAREDGGASVDLNAAKEAGLLAAGER